MPHFEMNTATGQGHFTLCENCADATTPTVTIRREWGDAATNEPLTPRSLRGEQTEDTAT